MMEENTNNYYGADQELLDAIEEVYSCSHCRTMIKSIWPSHWFSIDDRCCAEHMAAPSMVCPKCITDVETDDILNSPNWFELSGEDPDIVGSQD